MELLKKLDKRSELQKEADRLIAKMVLIEDQESDAYKAAADRLKIVLELRDKERGPVVKRNKIDPNEVLKIVGTFGAMALIMNFEKLSVIPTKAFSLVPKPRL